MREYEAIVERIAADRPGHILDWGCGFGQVSALLSGRELQVTSFDYRPGGESQHELKPLERYPHLQVHLGNDARLLPFPDRSFDAILSCGVLEHVEDPDASLEEIKRVLLPGGTFYIYKLPNRYSYLEAIAKLYGLYYHGAYPHDRVYGVSSALALLREHNFTVTEFRRMNMLPLTITGKLAASASRQIWSANRLLSCVPGLNLVATNLELVARAPR
jgi:ubiquinone/menaquinone biosynthesis C-methylase UbiE